jgi:hypothetical protein
MKLKSLLREYLENPEIKMPKRHNFLPNFYQNKLPVEIQSAPWERTDDLEWTISFQRREDLQDFVNQYLDLEEDQGVYARLTIDGLKVVISSDEQLPQRFRSMIQEIANETIRN